MIYTVRDKRGFVVDLLEVEPDTLNEFEVQVLIDKFIKSRHIDNITKFNIREFQQYLSDVKHVGSKSFPNFKVLNTRV